MYTSAPSNLQSAQWLNAQSSDRPSFQAIASRRFKGPRPFQVFVMPRGMLFLELRNMPGQASDGAKKAAIACGVMGGALGGLVGGLIMASSQNPSQRNDNGYELLDEDDLFELAGSRKRSFVAKNDDIKSVLIDAPSGWDRAFADRKLAGWITLRESTLGKVKMAIHDQFALSVAVDALPRRLGDRVQVNVEFDVNTTRFVRRRG